VFTAVFNIANEYHQVVRQFLGSKSLKELAPHLRAHFKTYLDQNMPPPKVAYTDYPEQDAEVIKECYPTIDPKCQHPVYGPGFGVKLCAIHFMMRVEKGSCMFHCHSHVHN